MHAYQVYAAIFEWRKHHLRKYVCRIFRFLNVGLCEQWTVSSEYLHHKWIIAVDSIEIYVFCIRNSFNPIEHVHALIFANRLMVFFPSIVCLVFIGISFILIFGGRWRSLWFDSDFCLGPIIFMTHICILKVLSEWFHYLTKHESMRKNLELNLCRWLQCP